MKSINKYISILSLGIVLFFASCQDDWLERNPPNILLDDQVWNDANLVLGTISNFYDRIPAHVSLTAGWVDMAAYDEAIWSGYSGNDWLNNFVQYGFDRWGLWDYGLIRDINLSLNKLRTVSNLPEERIEQFEAELRFIRAYVYFEHVKRMGGVPLVLDELIYDFSGDPSGVQVPRSMEEEIYDFIADEIDEIRGVLGNVGSRTRANEFTALALKSRAMLYAGSLANYNSQMGTPITLPGGEVGISASRANEYYTKALEASQEIIQSGVFQLYSSNPDLGENFYELFINKNDNPEVLWAQDFLASADKRHGFTYDNIARSVREDNLGSSAITPVLNLVEDYEYLDGSSGELNLRTSDDSDYIYYDDVTEVFANKDARLYGTVIYPGSQFRGNEIRMQAGVLRWNGNGYDRIEGNDLGGMFEDGRLLVGESGPHRNIQEVSNTGFYLRKYVDNAPQSSTRGVLSTVWWVRFRLGEIYLNAAEAAFELGQVDVARNYLNALRERAGFGANSLEISDVTTDRIRNERRVELAFEDHVVWDYKRWRIAHQKWDGNNNNPDAVMYALYPYRVIHPNDPSKDGKYVFERIRAPRFIAPRFFRMGNYYSLIGNNLVDANPRLVRNPFH
ncbi:RagB/SusD family nutrient uptake outer membrane protein [Belliella sp. DSM 111904]|uniref:RagB/SusD family nutrient uptake outer membrane protein n=1 Tax=Belliella filtrata TaxID=2923435 RepID=A0ABS9UW23_9BACT|nr:RagB/SusD family nutrient uptake outer membrane protein [Belliella filtrata]MCH7408274.1 RagB/SusD family nutrient uptake outer membrane protein [Belliella filtrata]